MNSILRKNIGRTIPMLLMFYGLFAGAGAQLPQIGAHNLQFVLVSPNGPADGGDFGPGTPGTQTGGIQEALTYAKANCRDVYIGSGNYTLATTLNIPWDEDWHIDCGNAVLTYTPANNGPAVFMDSQMSCVFRLPVISAPNIGINGMIVYMQPNSVGPDGGITITTSVIEIAGIIGHRSGGTAYGYGLVQATGNGGFGGIDVHVSMIQDCNIGMYVNTVGQNFNECPLIQGCNYGLYISNSSLNRFDVTTDCTGMSPGVGAYVTGGTNTNLFKFSTMPGSCPAGDDMIFDSSTANNIVVDCGIANGVTNTGGNNTKVGMQKMNRLQAASWRLYR